jgi:hypothetical protein
MWRPTDSLNPKPPLIERFARPGYDTLQYEATIGDPLTGGW